MRRATALLLVLGAAGCAVERLEMHGPPPRPFDALVVPGCPSRPDGTLSDCQRDRAIWAALIVRRGWARRVIASGAAVHTPYVEAEALAAAMAALGVPADRIWIEPDALHTDENAYDSARIARALGDRTIAVASHRGHAAWACRLMLDWGQPCAAISIDPAQVAAERPRVAALLDGVRTPRAASFRDLGERERDEARRAGRARRPPSAILYPAIGLLDSIGEPWIPHAPLRTPLQTWAQRATTVFLPTLGARGMVRP